MRRRLTLALVGLLAGTLLMAGVGTLVLTRQSARNQDIQELLTQAQGIVSLTQTVRSQLRCTPTASRSCVQRRIERATTLLTIRRVVRLADAKIVTVRPDGAFQGSLPSGIRPSDLQAGQLLSGRSVSGSRANLVFAAAPIVPTARLANTQVVVLTRQEGRLGPSLGYFLLIGAGTLAVGAVVAYRLSRRASRPLLAAVGATGRIAAGDLEARVPVHKSDYPEMASLAESINTMAAALARSRGLERQFLLSVSHDLRTPLTSIRGFAEAIADGTASDVARAATVIGGEAKRLERLVRDLLDLAKLDAQRFSLQLTRTACAPVVESTAEAFRPMIEQARLELQVDVGEHDDLWAVADPDRLGQVVANLIENAFNHARHHITVTAATRPPAVLIAVEDDGPGINREDIDRVFERLYQSGRERARQAGSGLGLAIVSELVTAMDATIEVRSPTTSTGGTRMEVLLRPWPEAPPPAAPPARAGLPGASVDPNESIIGSGGPGSAD